MPRQAKRQALIVLWVTIGISATLVRKPLVWLILGIVVLGVSAIIISTKTLEDIHVEPQQSDGNS